MEKVAIVGCGAVGLNYGMRLLEKELSSNVSNAPLDVNFLTRRDFELITKEGVRFSSSRGNDMHFTPEQLCGKVYQDASALARAKGSMDWILVAVKSYSINEELHQLISTIHEAGRTKLLIVLNGLGVEDDFVRWFGADHVFGVSTYVAINRGPNPPVEPGPLVVSSMADGKLEVAHVDDKEDMLELVHALFKGTKEEGFLEAKPCLLAMRWNKLVFNLVFSGMGVALGGVTIDIIRNDPLTMEVANRVITNTITVANIDIEHKYRSLHGSATEGECPFLLDMEGIRNDLLTKSKGAGPYKMSAVVDLVEGRPIEIDALFMAPVQRAKDLNIPLEKYSSLQDVALMAVAVDSIAKKKQALGVKWTPAYIADMM